MNSGVAHESATSRVLVRAWDDLEARKSSSSPGTLRLSISALSLNQLSLISRGGGLAARVNFYVNFLSADGLIFL